MTKLSAGFATVCNQLKKHTCLRQAFDYFDRNFLNSRFKVPIILVENFRSKLAGITF